MVSTTARRTPGSKKSIPNFGHTHHAGTKHKSVFSKKGYAEITAHPKVLPRIIRLFASFSYHTWLKSRCSCTSRHTSKFHRKMTYKADCKWKYFVYKNGSMPLRHQNISLTFWIFIYRLKIKSLLCQTILYFTALRFTALYFTALYFAKYPAKIRFFSYVAASIPKKDTPAMKIRKGYRWKQYPYKKDAPAKRPAHPEISKSKYNP